MNMFKKLFLALVVVAMSVVSVDAHNRTVVRNCECQCETCQCEVCKCKVRRVRVRKVCKPVRCVETVVQQTCCVIMTPVRLLKKHCTPVCCKPTCCQSEPVHYENNTGILLEEPTHFHVSPLPTPTPTPTPDQELQSIPPVIQVPAPEPIN